MATSPLPNVRSKNIEKERRRVLISLAKVLDEQERGIPPTAKDINNRNIITTQREQAGPPTLEANIRKADRAMLIAIRGMIKDSVKNIENLNISDEEKLQEIEKTLDEWKKQINTDESINPSVRTILFEYCDTQYKTASAAYAGNTDTHTKGQFDPEKFKKKVKGAVFDKIASKVQTLAGMGTIDAFLQFAGQKTLSSTINEKLGGVFNKGRSFRAEDAAAAEQAKLQSLPSAETQYGSNAQVQDVRNRVAAARSITSTQPTNNEELSEETSTAPRRVSDVRGARGGVAAVGVDSTKAIRLLTDIRDILAKQFKSDEDTKKKKDQEQADAELAAEAASETPRTEPIRVGGAEEDTTAAPPEAPAGGGIVSRVVRPVAAKAVKNVGGMLLQRIAPTAALSAVPGVAAAGGTAAASGVAAGGAAASGGMFAALSAGLSGLVAAIGPILLALAAVAAAVYLVYKIWKNIDFTPILEPLAKGFGLLKDVVSTLWPYFKALGKLIFTVLLVPFRILGFIIGKYISLMMKLIGPVLGPVIDGFTWLWKNAIKPLMEGFTSLLTFISDVIEDPWGFFKGTGKFAKKKEAPPAGQGQGQAPPEGQQQRQEQAPAPGGRGGGPGPRAAVSPTPGGRGGGPGPVGAPNSVSGVLSSLSAQMKDGYGGQATAGGATHAGVAAIAREVPHAVPGFNRFTGFNDTFHQEKSPKSLHTKGLAMDFTIHDPSKSPQAVAAVENIAKQHGVKVVVKDEYKAPSGHATAGHIHVQFPNEQEAQKMATALNVVPDVPGVAPPPVTGGAPASPAASPTPASPAFAAASPTPATPAAVQSGVSGTRAAAPIARGTAAVNAAQTMAPAVTMVSALAPAAAAAAAPPAPMMIPIPVKARTENLFAYQTINAV